MKPTGATDMSIYKTKRPRLRKPAICDERENEHLKNVILDFIDMVDGKGSPPLPVIISQMRLFVESK